MMFLVRTAGPPPQSPGIEVKLTRKTPEIVPNGAGMTDLFCVGEDEAAAALRSNGFELVELRDGWYADDRGGGVAIFGHGRYWEIRDTLFTVAEACGPGGIGSESRAAAGEHVEVRRAIFGV
jgi:hypothetical protein